MGKGKEPDTVFQEGQSYTSVYFLKVDAAGHSSIVVNNTSDLVDKVFDLFESMVFSTVKERKRLLGCAYADFWGWQGDGGLCVVYDQNESVALQTAIQSAFDILDFKLKEHQSTLARLNVKGNLHLRLALHRGSFTYKGYDRHGSIHSRDLNFVAHLEEVTPKDTLTISEDVYQRCPVDICSKFHVLEFLFEGTDIYLYSNKSMGAVMYDWISNIRIGESVAANVLPRRYSEEDKARIVQYATTEIVDLGTALRTCSYYLTSGHRPEFYRPKLIKLLDNGVNYICLALNPDSDAAKYYAALRNEDLKSDVANSISRMTRFANEVKRKPGKFELYLYSSLPYFAAIVIDRKKEGLLIYSPYMPSLSGLQIERADSPHLVLTKTKFPQLFGQIDSYVDILLKDHHTIKVL